MKTAHTFIDSIQEGYAAKGAVITLGKGKFNNEIYPDAAVQIPLKTLNRHGLIAGATGTGKTKTLQIVCEQLSNHGIPSLVMDVKGDLSGLARPGDANSTHTIERMQKLEMPYEATGFPVELLSLSDEKGVKLRATVTEFGPILFSKILGLNETQESIISVLFKFCDDHALPLIDLDDIKKVLTYVKDDEEGKEKFKKDYGSVSTASVGAILRKIVALEQQGAAKFFGEPSFDVNDLLRTKDGKGVINIVRLVDIQDKPALFSTFMLSLLAEVYSQFPEAGDLEKPKLCLFIDEAHLVFQNASKSLLEQIDTVVKLIRSKGIGVFFITQIPGDVPDSVLSQLGLKIQHALRGFTAKDRKEIKKAVENYPITEFYEADQVITQLGIGEAFITALNEKGIPTPLVYTHLVAPQSRMDVLTTQEIEEEIRNSVMVTKYSMDINRESAYEILSKKIEQAVNETPNKTTTSPRRNVKEETFVEKMSKNTMVRQLGRTAMREITRGVLGVLGVKRRY
ncbi:MAG: DUF853 family protein [Flavobacteriaceae bacterium]|nr:DUF853 family protein [Flavobacteriaceae bacterium]